MITHEWMVLTKGNQSWANYFVVLAGGEETEEQVAKRAHDKLNAQELGDKQNAWAYPAYHENLIVLPWSEAMERFTKEWLDYLAWCRAVYSRHM